MDLSIVVKGLVPPTEEYLQKLQVYQSCKKLKIPVPEELEEFFEDGACEYGQVIELPQSCYEEYDDEELGTSGIESDLTEVPKKVTAIRCYLSY